jgi:hypothetical protein
MRIENAARAISGRYSALSASAGYIDLVASANTF